MACGQERLLGQVMFHGPTPTEEQAAAIKRLEAKSRRFVESDPLIQITRWRCVAENLPCEYMGKDIRAAYKLTWDSIIDSVPQPGVAGSVPLHENVSADLRPFLLDPNLLRIPDGEVKVKRWGAAVLTSSD